MASTCKIKIDFNADIYAETSILSGWRSYVGPLATVGNTFETKTTTTVVMACDTTRPEVAANGFIVFDLNQIRNP